MPRRYDPDLIKKLEQRAAKADRDLRRARAFVVEQERAKDTRRKIIPGALTTEHALRNPASEFARIYVGLLKHSARPEDRWLFADIFRALLPSDEAESLLAEGEAAQAAAAKAKAEKRKSANVDQAAE